jgi:RHS repeat-associated protein
MSGIVVNTLTQNDADQQLTESYSGGILDGLSMNGTFDANLRRTTLEAEQGSTVRQSTGYAFDYAGRLGTVTDNSFSSYTAVYAYHANSILVSNIAFKYSTSVPLSTTRAFDLLNRLTSISSVASGTGAPKLPISFQYDYNTANQRVRCALEDGSYWIYQYDQLGQVTSGKRYWPDGTPVDGQQFEYNFDDIGNRMTTGGRASAASTYTRTSTNAYTQRTVAAVIDVLGIANPTASVTVNGNTANRHGEYFDYPLSVANSSAAYPTVTIASTFGGGASSSGKVFVPASTEAFTHDQDGNLTADGRWAYTWDGENRLVQMIRDTDSPTGAREKLVFTYDWMGRRIRKQFYTYSSGWVLSTDTIFLYDGWNLICEFDASTSQPGTLIRSYIWGTDITGSMQGAGGIGGLLKITDYVGSTTHHFVSYDGNGNVAALVDGGTGAITARYEYGPFAEPIRTIGIMAKKMPFRFSTKYTDNESGLIDYGYRYYNPSTGRWLTRDPIGELGGMNLYCSSRNDTINESDPLGLWPGWYRWRCIESSPPTIVKELSPWKLFKIIPGPISGSNGGQTSETIDIIYKKKVREVFYCPCGCPKTNDVWRYKAFMDVTPDYGNNTFTWLDPFPLPLDLPVDPVEAAITLGLEIVNTGTSVYVDRPDPDTVPIIDRIIAEPAYQPAASDPGILLRKDLPTKWCWQWW